MAADSLRAVQAANSVPEHACARVIPLSKCKFVAESLAKDDGIGDCLPESYGGFRGGLALTGPDTTAVRQTTGQDGTAAPRAARSSRSTTSQAIRGLRRGQGGGLLDRIGRVLLDARSVGVRQDHHAADDRRVRDARPRARSCSRATTSRGCRRTSATSTRCSSSTPCSRT